MDNTWRMICRGCHEIHEIEGALYDIKEESDCSACGLKTKTEWNHDTPGESDYTITFWFLPDVKMAVYGKGEF